MLNNPNHIPMKRALMVLALAGGFMLTAKAQIVQTMNLKDGSVMRGYLKCQKGGNNIVFFAEEAVVVMDGQKVRNISGKKVPFNSLPDEWKHYVGKNELLDRKRELTLSSIDTGNMISNVLILEQGKVMKYVELKHDYALRLTDVASVEYAPRDEMQLTGINRIMTVKKVGVVRTLTGQCIKEEPGAVTYLLKEDGVVESIDIDDLIKDNSIKNNPNQPLFEQSKLLDEIRTADGKVYTGIITERNYELANYCFVITMKTGDVESTQTIWMENVNEICKLPNPDYKEVRDIQLNPGQIMVNRNEVEQESMNEKDGKFVVVPTMKRLTLKMESKELDVDVEANFRSEKEAADNYFIKTKQFSKKDKKRRDSFYFTYRDMVESALAPIETSTSMNNTTKISYKVKDRGVYVFYNTTTKKAVVIVVE